MLRDPFYRQIYQALDGPLDPLVFERCMGDLLRPDYPWIVPVSGGTDSGMDGAIADGEGEPFPLVCTTTDDVIRNLTRSLDSYLDSNLPRRKVVLATSRNLTTRKRANLYQRAREKGFELLQIFEREAVADRLAGSPRWCKELLGLTWKPSALSTVPPTSRPLIDIEPVGREADLAWIEGTSEDRVLSGEPGSGKTFLFRYLMRQRNWPGLFLTESDLSQFRDAWVEQRPRIVVVDDAHVDPDLLSRLVRLREEMKASFEIIASTWEGGREAVMEALGVAAIRVRRLELLTRDEILQVIRQVGVQASNEVLRDLVSQAANKPGLAVTLASLWLQGSYKEVLEGTALTRTLTNFFRRFLGTGATDVLACLALGGDRGMGLEAIGTFLRLTLPETREIASGLAAAGVLSQLDRDVLAVWPRKLRFALLRSVFFSGTPASLRYRNLLDLAPSRESAVETIVAARHHRAEIPSQELRTLVAEVGSRDAWRGLAHVSEADAHWALEHYPGNTVEVAAAALNMISEEAILHLLKCSETASGPTHSHPRHPMRILQEWVEEIVEHDVEEMVRRRKLLARISKRYLRDGGRHSVGLHGICLALSPSLESHSSDPGMGRTITIRSGLLPLQQLKDVKSIWSDVQGELRGMEAEDWQHLSSVLWNWMHPSYAARGQEVPEEKEEFMRSLAMEMLKDVAPAVRGEPGLTAKLRELAEEIGLHLSLEPDPVFDLFFPSIDFFLEDREQREAEWATALGELVARWASQEPGETAKLLASYEREAQSIGRAWPPRGDSEVCRRIAAMTESPEVWLDGLLSHGASGVLTGPFLERLVDVQREGWQDQVERFLGLERQHAWSAVESVLRLPSPPDHLLKKALARLTELPQLLDGLCMRRQVPVETLRSLFHHPNRELALIAAVGEWNADREGRVRPELAADWNSAILRAKAGDFSGTSLNSSTQYWLGVILAKDPELAFDWLIARLRDQKGPYFLSEQSPFVLAISVLQKGQKLRLIEELTKGSAPEGFVGLLVGKDSEIFKKVLSSESLRSHHLEPLGFLPDQDWLEFALLALEAGHEPAELVRASLWPLGRGIRVQWGTGVEDWQRYEQAFSNFEDDARNEVREIARLGQRLTAELCAEATNRERQRAIRGF